MLGASVGALLRWWLSVKFNAVSDNLFLGTLMANVLACSLMGFLLGFESSSTVINNALRIAFLTGFLGSLSTFSTFIAEVHANLLLRDWFKLMLGFNLQIGLGLISFYFSRLLGQSLQ